MRQILITIGLVASLGCSPMKPDFVHRDEFNDVLPEGQAAIDALMTEYFGTPTEMKIWEKLPIKHSSATGTVESPVQSGDAVVGLTVAWQEENWEIEPGDTVAWLIEELKVGDSAELPRVASYDAETRTITFKKPLTSVPPEGTRIAVNPGGILHQGRILYAEHCQHCHGVSGDGAGPTAQYLNPRPRDYRDGIFKFTSTVRTHQPSRSDLARIIEEGIPGTYMPSFKLLTPRESDAIVEYVRWLSMRGQTEKLLIAEVADKPSLPTGIADQLRQLIEEDVEVVISRFWNEAEQPEFLITPETKRPKATPESIARGRELFLSTKAKCSDCHGKTGQGNGFQTLQVEENQTEPGLHDIWGNIVKPRNLRSGIFRGGRRPIDIYRRVAAGVKGTPMQGFQTALYNPERKDEDIWHVVNFVLFELPYHDLELGQGIGAETAQQPDPKPEPKTADAAE